MFRRPILLAAIASLASLALVLAPQVARAGDLPADVAARWVAGIAPPPGIEPSAEWSAYARTEDERWQKAAPRLTAMHEWSSREVTPLLPADRAVFYPFAGPDALHAMALFGGSPRLFLVGLEPVGALPDPARTPAGFFDRLGAALGDVHRLTFFRTHAMVADFQRDGILGALVATVVRMGGKVASVQTSVQTSSAPASARIDWVTPTGQARRLDYVQADLSNAALKDEAPFVAAVHALGPYVTFIKAASYLIGEARFSYVRQMIMDDSAVVLQDDSGVPFRAFDARWALRFFGRYETPVSPFQDRVQPDLRAAFEQRAHGLLPFGIGYSMEARRSNLLIACKGSK